MIFHFWLSIRTPKTMSVICSILNVALPPLSLILLPIIMLPYIFFKLLIYIKRLVRTENMARKVVLITGAASGIGEVWSLCSIILFWWNFFDNHERNVASQYHYPLNIYCYLLIKHFSVNLFIYLFILKSN